MKPEKAAWLALTREVPIDPDQIIIDPHHHLWHRSGSKYLFDDLQADTAAGHKVVGTVFVECLSNYLTEGLERFKPVGETAFVREQSLLSAKSAGAPILGIVSFADLALGDAVEEVLLAHEQAGGGLFRGIRHPTSNDEELGWGHVETPAGLMLSDEFQTGFARLGKMGYSYDAWLFHHQLPELVALAQAQPDVPIVLDHIGGPLGVVRFSGQREQVRSAWRKSMKAVAACPNIILKVGGIGMNRYYGGGWPELPQPPGSEILFDYWGDDLIWCIDLFGPQRCMFESNFPVDRETCDYTVLWNVYQRVGQRYSAAERDQLFYKTAVQTYRLSVPALEAS
ncbi:MAG: amidohydrolase family protein [Burkholderiaceae bacterium]